MTVLFNGRVRGWCESGNLVWSQRLDLQRVDREGEQIVDAGQYLLMAMKARNPGKRVRHDEQRKVPGAAGGTGVTHVIGTIVPDLERGWSEIRQPQAEGGWYVGHDFSGR